jgi:hypothetical protein
VEQPMATFRPFIISNKASFVVVSSFISKCNGGVELFQHSFFTHSVLGESFNLQLNIFSDVLLEVHEIRRTITQDYIF